MHNLTIMIRFFGFFVFILSLINLGEFIYLIYLHQFLISILPLITSIVLMIIGKHLIDDNENG